MVRGSSEGGRLPKNPSRQEQTLLTLTEHAQTAVRTLTQDPQAPESAGLRITPGNDGLELTLVAEPVPGDALIDDGGARVFVEPMTSQLLDEQTLDAEVEGGKVNFFLAPPDATSPPDTTDAKANQVS
jgi:iron-sulfur cluster assembly protein